MSYLSTPRIYFGGTWKVDVATGNNSATYTIEGKDQELLDFANVAVNPVTIGGQPATDAQLRDIMGDSDNSWNWNYWGTNTATFQTSVTAVDLGDGPSARDPLVGKPAAFQQAALCDSNPSGSQSTQMFFGDFTLDQTELSPDRAFSRWVWFYRNGSLGGSAGASGVFQTVIPMTAEQWTALLASDSPAVTALYAAYQAAGPNAAGLSIRYCLYATTSDADVPGSPYVTRVGQVSGVIGLALSDEMVTYPTSRRLANQTAIAVPNRGKPINLGPVLALVNKAAKTVTLDLCTALPEQGSTFQTLQKVDLGTLTVTLSDGKTSLTVGSLTYGQYSMPNLTGQGGLVTLSYASQAAAVEALLDSGDFAIVTASGVTLFTEVDAVETDDRNVYLQDGGSGSIVAVFTRRGQAVAGEQIFLSQYAVTDGDTDPTSDCRLLTIPQQVTTDEQGRATIPVTATATGNSVIQFTPGKPATGPVNVLNDGFANLRILPSDDYSAITDEELMGEPGFQYIYDNVLRFYYLTFPCMQPIVDFSNYTVMTSRAVLQMLRTVTGENLWWNYGYMPRSRDLSDSRRTLLHRWIDLTLAAQNSAPQGK